MVGKRVRTTALATAIALVLVGCASSPSAPTSATESATAARPMRTAPDPLIIEARSRLAGMTLEQRISSMLMLHIAGTDPASIRAQVDRYSPGGIILMPDNTAAGVAGVQAITAAVQSDPELPRLVAIDQEGGEVSRLAEDAAPGAEALRGADPAATTTAFSARAALLASAGVTVNFGIVADVTADPASFLSGRVLGTDPAAAADRVEAAVAGEHGIVASTLKHFPGHGAAPGDSHRSLPVAAEGLESWRAGDAVPFRAGIRAGAELVMFGHLDYSAVDAQPASLSPTWHRILRDDLGFRGLTITDDMGMLEAAGVPAYADRAANAIAAINAGNSMLLYVPAPDPAGFDPDVLVSAIAAAVHDGRIQQATIDRAALALLAFRLGAADAHTG